MPAIPGWAAAFCLLSVSTGVQAGPDWTRISPQDSQWGLAQAESRELWEWTTLLGRFGMTPPDRGTPLSLYPGDLLIPWRPTLQAPSAATLPASTPHRRVIRFPVRPPAALPEPIAWFDLPAGDRPDPRWYLHSGPLPETRLQVSSIYPLTAAAGPDDTVYVTGEHSPESGSEWHLVAAPDPVPPGTRTPAFRLLTQRATGVIDGAAGNQYRLTISEASGPVRPGLLAVPARESRYYRLTDRPVFDPDPQRDMRLKPARSIPGLAGAPGTLVALNAGIGQGVSAGSVYEVRQPPVQRFDPLNEQTVTYPAHRTGLLLTLGVFDEASFGTMLSGRVNRERSVRLVPAYAPEQE